MVGEVGLVGVDRSDRDQLQTYVTYLLQQTMKGGLANPRHGIQPRCRRYVQFIELSCFCRIHWGCIARHTLYNKATIQRMGMLTPGARC